MYFIKHTFILSKLIIKDKTKMWKSCAGLNALYECIQICQLIYLSHQHLQQFQDFRNNLPFSGKNSLFLPHQFLFSKSMYWGSGVFNVIWSKPSFRKNATLYFTPAPLRRTSYISGLLECFLLSTLNQFLKKDCLLRGLPFSRPLHPHLDCLLTGLYDWSAFTKYHIV